MRAEEGGGIYRAGHRRGVAKAKARIIIIYLKEKKRKKKEFKRMKI